MNDPRTVVITAVSVLAMFITYHLFSRNNAMKEIKRLTEEIKVNTDSLQAVNIRYDSLLTAYDQIYSDLKSTRADLSGFKQSLEDLMGSNIRSVTQIKRSLDDLVSENEMFFKMDQDSTSSFRL